jgi:hypothetical protein
MKMWTMARALEAERKREVDSHPLALDAII